MLTTIFLTQSFCENSSASFKGSLNVKFVLICILHNIIICDLLNPIVACRTRQGSTDPPCTLDMRIYPSNMMIIPIVLSHKNSIPTITGRFEESITDSTPDCRRFRTIFDSAQDLCKTPKEFFQTKRNVCRTSFGALQKDLAYSRAAARRRR